VLARQVVKLLHGAKPDGHRYTVASPPRFS
jgi:hypothetical protein